MTQAVSAARQLNCKSACKTIWFAPTTAAANTPIAIPARAPRALSSMMGSIHRVYKTYFIFLRPRFTGMRDGAGVSSCGVATCGAAARGAGAGACAGLKRFMIASR